MLLSVIIPIHNSAKYLPKCIESIINQSLNHDEFEIILVENASTDNSLEICKNLKDKYKKHHIIVIHTETPGVGNARNIGIDASHGQYIHFIDSDDWIENKMYSTLLSERRNNYDLLITGIINDYEKQNHLVKETALMPILCVNKKQISNFLLQLDNKQKIWTLNVIWNKWYKADLIKKHNIRFRNDINLGEDFVFNCYFFMKIETLKISSDAFYHYMHRENVSLVNKFRTDTLYRRPIIYNTYCKLYAHYGILQERKKDIDLLEGKLLFGSLYTLFNRDCNISLSNKLNFIKQICESQHFSLAFSYLKSCKDLYHKFLILSISKQKYIIIYLILKLRVKLKRKITNY